MEKESIFMRRRQATALLLKVCLEDAKTEDEIIEAKLDFDFFQKCLELQQIRLLFNIGAKGRNTGYKLYTDTIERLLEERIDKGMQLGLNKLIDIKVSDIESASYSFFINHTIEKGKRNIRHTNNLEFYANDEDTAISLLHRKLKAIDHRLISINKVSKKLSGIIANGDYYRVGTFSLIKD